MYCYKVNFGDYSVAHYYSCKHLNYFEFKGKKYPIGAFVKLTKDGEYQVMKGRGYNFIRGNYRLVDHCFTESGVEKWEYIIGKTYETGMHIFHTTTQHPDELVEKVMCAEFNEVIDEPGELKVEFKEPSYFPKDWEVEGVMTGWSIMALVWIAAWVLKDWWLRLIIQIGVCWYFGSWREKKMNEAISNQKFKK